mgnify:FL=1
MRSTPKSPLRKSLTINVEKPREAQISTSEAPETYKMRNLFFSRYISCEFRHFYFHPSLTDRRHASCCSMNQNEKCFWKATKRSFHAHQNAQIQAAKSFLNRYEWTLCTFVGKLDIAYGSLNGFNNLVHFCILPLKPYMVKGWEFKLFWNDAVRCKSA